MAGRTTLKVLTYIHDEDNNFDAFKKVCRKFGGQYLNFSLGHAKRFGFIFQKEEQLNAAFEEWNSKRSEST